MNLRKFKDSDLLTDSDLQELVGVSRATLWRLCKADGIPHGQVGQRYRYLTSGILAILPGRPRSASASVVASR